MSPALNPPPTPPQSESLPSDRTETLQRPHPPRKPEIVKVEAKREPEAVEEKPPERPSPIPTPSEPKQYRAIGLVRGRYVPSEEQLTRGDLLTADETPVQAVLLGRVMSLVKNHVDLDREHVWVVYPRTGQKDGKLHLQIVGVWEPETLHQSGEDSTLTPIPSSEVEDGYFSVRGEVIFYSEERECIIVKIRQSPRKQNQPPKFFKVQLKGKLEGKLLRHFWDFQVLRQGEELVVQGGEDIGPMPPKRRQKKGGGRRPSQHFKGKEREGRGGRRSPSSPEGTPRRPSRTPRPRRAGDVPNTQ
ncbi:MAG: hypothetical protein J7641_09295 [Cyanobacteria bacterium SID2]|nr:hypothetical protein [Cyanobacteria bacterium SID2]MBP0005837.1 hypothetical protein [Cyanobacteria bacterium SBC]